MAQSITIDLPSGTAERIIHALCAGAGQSEDGLDGARQALVDHITRTVVNVEQSEAMAAQAVQPVESTLPDLGL